MAFVFAAEMDAFVDVDEAAVLPRSVHRY